MLNLNNMKDKLKESGEGKSKWKKFKIIFQAVFCVIVVITIVGILLGRQSTSDMVKNGKLQAYPEKTIEAAFEGAFGPGGEWVEYEQYGSDMVAYNVVCMNHMIKVLFVINSDNKTFNTYQLYLDGTDYTYDMQEFLDAVYHNPLIFKDDSNYSYY